MSSSHPVIAIDGTAASGKSTFAQRLAARLGYVYINTGLMYRGVTWFLLDRGVALEDAEAVTRDIEEAGVMTTLENGALHFLIGGVDPQPHVREARINQGVSIVAQVPAVRQLLVARQRELAPLAPLVMEGRDIGTVVFPDTPYKFYIDADAAVRAQRRERQGESDMIRQRDVLDSQRKASPLTRAPDALALDSGVASVDELVVVALQHLTARGLVF
jgi:cytidylate kinase